MLGSFGNEALVWGVASAIVNELSCFLRFGAGGGFQGSGADSKSMETSGSGSLSCDCSASLLLEFLALPLGEARLDKTSSSTSVRGKVGAAVRVGRCFRGEMDFIPFPRLPPRRPNAGFTSGDWEFSASLSAI